MKVLRRLAASAMALTLAATGMLVETTAAQAIIGGSNAGYLRGQVQIWVNGNFSCSGSLVHVRWVLTSSHCVPLGIPTYGIGVYLGDRRFGAGHRSAVNSMQRRGEGYDLMLIELAQPARADQVIKLGYGSAPVNQEVSISGWGQTNHPGDGPPQVSPVLKICGVRIYRDNQSHYTYHLVYKGSGFPSYGDSGAGLIYRNRVVGVYSNSNHQRDYQWMGIAFMTIAHLNWIHTASRNEVFPHVYD
ncbi:trypsin-like serine protease [Solwaraspora sp. WMMD791]|uniref:trypsin-like serine protease n=1 Tax=Solwaraspora sp. WMMD791 TaxID=3016086 RepID=UPI00249C77AD|nr:trypsin-like serine protease [Solwaraspora sp. WMMD791]WFE25907.1 trypsin-like serine protease [Solwaraspora sp. WMMD791]